MTQLKSAPTNEGELITIARSKLGVTFAGPITSIATGGSDCGVKLNRGAGAFALTSGSATAKSGAIVVAFPGTKVRANSGSVVIAYRDVEVIAHKRAIVLRVTPFVQV